MTEPLFWASVFPSGERAKPLTLLSELRNRIVPRRATAPGGKGSPNRSVWPGFPLEDDSLVSIVGALLPAAWHKARRRKIAAALNPWTLIISSRLPEWNEVSNWTM